MFKEKASWQAAVNQCSSYGTDWVLPSLDNQYDITVINEGMKNRTWKSVWTGIKREIFDAYYWEDGTLDGKCLFHNLKVLPVRNNNSQNNISLILKLTFITIHTFRNKTFRIFLEMYSFKIQQVRLHHKVPYKLWSLLLLYYDLVCTYHTKTFSIIIIL